MMLLAAVVLILGFVALTGLVARVNQLPGQITASQVDPLFLEIDPVAEMANRLVDPDVADDGLATYHAAALGTHATALQRALDHLKALEAAKGFHYDYAFCTGTVAGTATLRSTLSTQTAQLSVRTQQFAYTGATVAC